MFAWIVFTHKLYLFPDNLDEDATAIVPISRLKEQKQEAHVFCYIE